MKLVGDHVLELRTNAVHRAKRLGIQIVAKAPVGVLLKKKKKLEWENTTTRKCADLVGVQIGVVRVEHGEMVAVGMGKGGLGLVCLLGLLARPHENVGRREQRHHRQQLVAAVVFVRVNQTGGQLRLQRKLGHEFALRRRFKF